MMHNALNCAAQKAPSTHGERPARIVAPTSNGQVASKKVSAEPKKSTFFVSASNGRVVVSKTR